jgi:hypothetical protein
MDDTTTQPSRPFAKALVGMSNRQINRTIYSHPNARNAMERLAADLRDAHADLSADEQRAQEERREAARARQVERDCWHEREEFDRLNVGDRFE